MGAEVGPQGRWKEEPRSRRDGHVWERVSRPASLEHRKCAPDLVPELPSLEVLLVSFPHPFLRIRRQGCLLPNAAPQLCWKHGPTEAYAVLFHHIVLCPTPDPTVTLLSSSLPPLFSEDSGAPSLFTPSPDLPPQSYMTSASTWLIQPHPSSSVSSAS